MPFDPSTPLRTIGFQILGAQQCAPTSATGSINRDCFVALLFAMTVRRKAVTDPVIHNTQSLRGVQW